LSKGCQSRSRPYCKRVHACGDRVAVPSPRATRREQPGNGTHRSGHGTSQSRSVLVPAGGYEVPGQSRHQHDVLGDRDSSLHSGYVAVLSEVSVSTGGRPGVPAGDPRRANVRAAKATGADVRDADGAGGADALDGVGAASELRLTALPEQMVRDLRVVRSHPDCELLPDPPRPPEPEAPPARVVPPRPPLPPTPRTDPAAPPAPPFGGGQEVRGQPPARPVDHL
jgi:hypothetical protein